MNAISRPTVLIVNDIPENISVLSGMLHDQYRAVFATSCKDALAIVQQQLVDLVLLDVMNPDMGGEVIGLRLQIVPKKNCRVDKRRASTNGGCDGRSAALIRLKNQLPTRYRLRGDYIWHEGLPNFRLD